MYFVYLDNNKGCFFVTTHLRLHPPLSAERGVIMWWYPESLDMVDSLREGVVGETAKAEWEEPQLRRCCCCCCCWCGWLCCRRY